MRGLPDGLVSGSRRIGTSSVAPPTALRRRRGHTVAARGMCCVYGDTGLAEVVAAVNLYIDRDVLARQVAREDA